MISVNELISNPVYNQKILVEGCIVIIDKKLWLIDLAYINNYPNSVKIRIINDNLKQILLNSVALYSGVTALFHDAKITGYLSNELFSNQLDINVIELCIKDGNEWKHIDVNNSVKHIDIEEKSDLDWHDLFK